MIGRCLAVLATVVLLAACGTEPGPNTGSSDSGGTAADGGSTDATSAADTADVVIPKLFINEVVAKAAKGDPKNPTASDWLELYNGDKATIDLMGYRLIDSSKKGFDYAFALPAGTKISAGGYLVVFFNHDGAGSPVIGKGLSGDEAATLFHPSGKLIDQVNWEKGDAPEGKSWGRVPDGSKIFKTMAKPTQGAANQ